jgi:hypothetical protein
MVEACKSKAMEMMVESLKMYVTLSTLFFAGLLAYYSRVRPTNSLYLLAIALFFLLMCAIISVINLNHLISKTCKADLNINAIGARTINFIWF